MALPPWTIEVLRRGLTDVARKASEPQTLEKIRSQATEMLQELPQTAARGIDAVLRTAEAGKRSVEQWSRKHTALAIPMLNRAFEAGLNYNDTAVGYCNQDSQRAVAEALKGWRDNIVLTTKNHEY